MLAHKISVDTALHTKEATQVWRDCASARIALQGALQSIHKFPESPKAVESEVTSLRGAIFELLKSSASRVSKMHGNQSDDPSWEYIDQLNRSMMAYCLSTADFWHESTRAPNRKNFKALDQSISAQMEYVMNDPDGRAVKRCKGASEEEYDDAPLYAALLKESVQKGASGEDYRAMKMASKFGKKPSSKEIDRRASKGRKIRYSAIDKLVNFMAPRPVPVSEGIPITDEVLINAFVNSVFH